MQVTRRMTRRQAAATRAAAQAQAEQNVRDALNQGMEHPSQWGAWPTPPGSQETGGSSIELDKEDYCLQFYILVTK